MISTDTSSLLAAEFDAALVRHRAGEFAEAERGYLAVLQADPRHAQANHNLGALLLQRGMPAEGLSHLLAALEADPARAQYWTSYIDALSRTGHADAAQQVRAIARQQGLHGEGIDEIEAGVSEPQQHQRSEPGQQEIDALVSLFGAERYAEAEETARAMTARYPRHGFGWKVLGAAYKQMGRSSDALLPMQKAVELSPGDADAHSNLGCVLNELGRWREAETSLECALKLRPDFAPALSNLGITLQHLGRLGEAMACYRRALQIAPDYAEAHFNLACICKQQGELNDAEAHYRLALHIKPNYAEAHNNLGAALLELGRFDEAEASCRQALRINPDFAEAHTNLANILMERGLPDGAEAHYRQAIRINPNYAEAHYNLGSMLKEVNRLSEAECSYREALAINPDFLEAQSNLLFLINYISDSPSLPALAQARRYGELVKNKATAPFAQWSCDVQAERLRIGFVSGDFRNHPVGYFIESLLPWLQATFDLYAYPTNSEPDDLTCRIKSHFVAWHPLAGLSDEAAARLIHGDNLHLLIDLSGHTRYNRLPVFAWKPAPVQVSWLGYFSTTGVAEIDYLIADPWVLPEAEERYFTEKIWRLPETRLCFTPPDIEIGVSSLPALSNGYVTFGCFNNLSKLNDAVIALWSRVLLAVPNSRLFLKAQQFKVDSVCRHTIERFAGHGVDASRLILEGPESRAKYLAAYHRVDIALDPFPFPGGTTSVESLWMGVPVLSLAGKCFLSRQGVGIMMNAGLPEWVAADADDYLARAITHAQDLQRLAMLRNGLRAQILTSPLFNAAQFVRHFEAALRGMWQAWRDGQT